MSGAGDGGGSPAEEAAARSDTLALTLAVPAEVREREAVPITLRVENVSGRPLNLYLRGRTVTFDVSVSRPDALLWNRLHDEIIPTIVRIEPLAAGAALELTHSWDQRSKTGASLAPGNYSLRAELLTEGAPLRTEPAVLRILPAAPGDR